MNPTTLETELPAATRFRKVSFVVLFAGVLGPLLAAGTPAAAGAWIPSEALWQFGDWRARTRFHC